MTRPAAGLGHYVRDVVNGALDGVITTVAVLAGAEGAALGARVGLILGLANLLGDGISMGASNYLGLRSELEQTGGSIAAEAPWRHGLATLAAFMLVGAVPLGGYLLAPAAGIGIFPAAVALGVVALAIAGAVRSKYVGKSAQRSAIEMLAVGIAAGGAAFLVGRLASLLIH
jgi:VIT1/CCC1 family predicted Fe2+/Mn2+ transporter